MKKSLLKSLAGPQALSLLLAASLGLTACEAPKAGQTKIDEKAAGNATPATSGVGSATNTGSNTGTNTGTGTGTTTDIAANTGTADPNTGGTPGAPATGTAGGASENPAAANQQKSELDDLPQLNAVRTVNLGKLKDTVVICTVNGTPLTVGGFKKEFREAVFSLQGMLTSQPGKVNQLLADARQIGVELTPDERSRLLSTARRKEALDGKTFADFLKDKKVTEKQFDEQVLMLGLAFKTGTKLIESQLLSEMINRELLLHAAKEAGYYRVAMNRFIEFKHTPKYTQVMANSTETPEQVKEEVTDHEMMMLMMDQIAKNAVASEATLKDTYEKNKQGFKHGERLRISHIVIAAPSFDNPPLESIRTQIKRQKPGITPDELDKEEKVLKVQQQNKASELLARALKGEDFKTLADRYSDDVQARALKAGGDLGFVDTTVKLPGVDGQKSDQEKLLDAVKDLKIGQVAPNLVQTNYGWHIVKLTEKQPAGLLTYNEVKPSLKQLIGQQNKEVAEQAWMKDARKKASIKLSDEFTQVAAKEKSTPSVVR